MAAAVGGNFQISWPALQVQFETLTSAEHETNQKNRARRQAAEQHKTTTARPLSPVHSAVAKDDLEQLRDPSLDRGNINTVAKGMTPIMRAAGDGREDLIAALLAIGADPNIRGGEERTALQYATHANDIASVRALLRAGAKIDAVDDEQLSPLVMAANRNYTGIALLLIKEGADVNSVQVAGWTALLDAARHGNSAVVNSLLNAGADPDAVVNGSTAARLARQGGHNELARPLGGQ
jgi:ankyrin repeat protein